MVDRRDGATLETINALDGWTAWALAIDPTDGELVIGDGLGGLLRTVPASGASLTPRVSAATPLPDPSMSLPMAMSS